MHASLTLHPLYIKQKRVICLVCKTCYLEHTAELSKSLYVLLFYDLMKYKIAIFIYKVYHLYTSGRCNRQSKFTLLHFTIFQ